MSKRRFEWKTGTAQGERRPVAGPPYRQSQEQQARDYVLPEIPGYVPRALDLKALAASPTDRRPTRPAVAPIDPLGAQRARVRGQRQGTAARAASLKSLASLKSSQGPQGPQGQPRRQGPRRTTAPIRPAQPKAGSVAARLLAVLKSDPARDWSVFELRAHVEFDRTFSVATLLKSHILAGVVAALPSARGPNGFGGKRYRWTGARG